MLGKNSHCTGEACPAEADGTVPPAARTWLFAAGPGRWPHE